MKLPDMLRWFFLLLILSIAKALICIPTLSPHQSFVCCRHRIYVVIIRLYRIYVVIIRLDRLKAFLFVLCSGKCYFYFQEALKMSLLASDIKKDGMVSSPTLKNWWFAFGVFSLPIDNCLILVSVTMLII